MNIPDHGPGDTPGGLSNWTPLTEPDAHPIELRHVHQLINAEAFSASQGWPFLAHVTIHLRLSEAFTPATWSSFQTHLMDKAARWLHRRDIPVAFAWVRENGPVKGPHLHLLLHLPHDCWGVFRSFILYAGRFTPSDTAGEAIRISGGAFGMHVPSMRAGLLRYVLKELDDPAVCTELGIRQHQGLPVRLKRIGVSHTVSQLARQRAGWKELHTVNALHAHLHPISVAKAEANYAV